MNSSHDKSKSASVGSLDESIIEENYTREEDRQDSEERNVWSVNTPFIAWLVMCYAMGPTAAMMRTYVTAAMQSIAHALGHPKGNALAKCLPRGSDCYIQFAGREVQYTAYVLYFKAAYTSLEGVVAILLMGLADYSNYRKWLMSLSIVLYGLLALPFIGLSSASYANLMVISALYCLMLCCNTIYVITEGSYIPIFMRKFRRNIDKVRVRSPEELGISSPVDESLLRRGSTVSVLGLVMGNFGGITALLIGVIITRVRGTPAEVGYRDFLLAISIAGCLTAVLGTAATFKIPAIRGDPFPFKSSESKFLTVCRFPLVRFKTIIVDLWQYKEAFKYVIAWVLWNISYSTYMQLMALSFRQVLGIGSSDKEYTIWNFMTYIVACVGPFAWMGFFQRLSVGKDAKRQASLMKKMLYFLLSIGTFSNVWASLGVRKGSSIGLQHSWEFWLFQILFVGSSSAIRSINRVVYSAILPAGKENQYFGLEIMLGLATGWSQSILVSVIQDKTGNKSAPYIPNACLMLVSAFFYFWSNMERGMVQAQKTSTL